eukprot:2330657-Pleurochrysis_carterae.AAC.2
MTLRMQAAPHTHFFPFSPLRPRLPAFAALPAGRSPRHLAARQRRILRHPRAHLTHVSAFWTSGADLVDALFA